MEGLPRDPPIKDARNRQIITDRIRFQKAMAFTTAWAGT
jgi:hypothetical protein